MTIQFKFEIARFYINNLCAKECPNLIVASTNVEICFCHNKRARLKVRSSYLNINCDYTFFWTTKFTDYGVRLKGRVMNMEQTLRAIQKWHYYERCPPGREEISADRSSSGWYLHMRTTAVVAPGFNAHASCIFKSLSRTGTTVACKLNPNEPVASRFCFIWFSLFGSFPRARSTGCFEIIPSKVSRFLFVSSIYFA